MNLSERLVTGYQGYEWIISTYSKPWYEFSICSAFLKLETLVQLSNHLPTNRIVRILVRWQLADLLAGVSDLEVYNFAKKKEWALYVDLAFHGKVYSFNGQGLLVGSANATNAGLGLSQKSNNEVCTILEDKNENNEFVDTLFINSVLVDDNLFDKFSAALKIALTIENNVKTEWSKDILETLNLKQKKIESLLLSECFSGTADFILGNFSAVIKENLYDLNLIGYAYNHTDDFDLDIIGSKFRSSKIYIWLIQELKKNEGQLYFGLISRLLHGFLINDPSPYRRDVKQLVVNLYSWIKVLGEIRTGLSVVRPNHSELIILL
jgi:hypothetical protein